MKFLASGVLLVVILLAVVGARFADDSTPSKPGAAAAATASLPVGTSSGADAGTASTATAAASSGTPSIPARAEIVAVRRIWDRGEHNAFTDLARHGAAFYCVFREAKAHVAPDGGVRVLRSLDGDAWESAALVTLAGSDLRDPKLTHAPDGRLMLTAAGVKKGTYQTLTWHSEDGGQWQGPTEIGEPNMWLWRPVWHGNAAFAVGYGTAQHKLVRLYRSEDGAAFATLVSELFADEYPNEATLLFMPDDSAFCLLRRDAGSNTAQLGTAAPPYVEWKWRDLGRRIAAPNLLRLDDGRIVAAGRAYTGGVRTALLWLDPQANRLTEFLSLPSGGDTGCPGLAWHDGHLWVSYYASHDGKASIYLAKVRLPPAE